jgi:hypothetical protein
MNYLILSNLFNNNYIQLNPINIIDASISLFFAGLFGFLISFSYKYSSQSISGGRQIMSSIMPLSLSICVIITIVKSSLALSLGLVGALSIVRFRTPIKDPEDLIYLFLAIVCGLGFGANQNIFTSLGISTILITLAIRSNILSKSKKKLRSRLDFNLNLEWEGNNLTIKNLIDQIENNCQQISFIRHEKIGTKNSLIVQISLFSNLSIDKIIEDIKYLDKEIEIQIYNSNIDY